MSKIILYDIEVSRSLVEGYGNRWDFKVIKFIRPQELMCYSYKELGEKNVHFVSRHDFKTYFDFVKSLQELLDSADVTIAHNGGCVTVDTPVLKSDLTWVRAGDLKNDDEIVGFDEGLAPLEKNRKDGLWHNSGIRNVRLGNVVNHKIVKRPSVRVNFTDGTSQVVTANHYWLAQQVKDNNYRYYRADRLVAGQRITQFMQPWEVDTSYEAGWLSGFISGEGTIKGNGQQIDWCQRPTDTLNQSLQYAKRLGLDISDPTTKAGGLGRGDTKYVYTRGGKWKTLETLGRLRVNRLISNIDFSKFGSLRSKNAVVKIVESVEDAGMQEIAEFETTCKTYFANGYPMHNSFDDKMANRFFVTEGISPPKPRKTIDTKREAKRWFRFESNKLDDLGDFLGLGRKETIGYADLEDDFMSDNPSKSTIRKMRKYNDQDVRLLERVYLKLRPYMASHPNLGDMGGVDGICPKCGSSNLHKRGFNRKRSGITQRYQCQDCFGWCSEASIRKQGRVVNGV